MSSQFPDIFFVSFLSILTFLSRNMSGSQLIAQCSLLSLAHPHGILIISKRVHSSWSYIRIQFRKISLCITFANINFNLVETRVEVEKSTSTIELPIILHFGILTIIFFTQLHSNSFWSY